MGDQERMEEMEELAIHSQAYKMMLAFYQRVSENHQKFSQLMTLYSKLRRHPDFSTDPAIGDMLRASVVFLHATLEDFLRTVATVFLPDSDSKVLDEIPLIGTTSRNPQKFNLGALS